MDPDAVSRREFYALLNSVVVPRPIAWVSSQSADGVLNLAPHSFFTVSCVQPPMVQFTSVGRKDSLNNVEATREFVVNFAAEPLYEQVNASATNLELGDCTVVIGCVRHLALDAAVMVEDHPEVQRLRPLARLGKDEWSTIGEVRSITRIRHSNWPGHFKPPTT